MIKSCISPDCYEYATDPSQLCESHLAAHIERCATIQRTRSKRLRDNEQRHEAPPPQETDH